MRKPILFALILNFVVLSNCLNAEMYTILWVETRGSGDSLEVKGHIKFLDPDSTNQPIFLLNPNVAIHSIYFQSDHDSIPAVCERTQGDTITVSRPNVPAFAQSRILSFDLAVPVRGNDSLIMLDRGNRWYPVLPRGLTKVTLNRFLSGDEDVFSTGNEEIHLSGNFMVQQFITAIPVYKIPLVIARKGYYRSCRQTVGNHEIALNYFSLSDSTAKSILAEAAAAFAFYQDLLGEYHHKKLTIIEVPGFEGTNIGTGILIVGTPTIQAIAAGQRESLTLTIASQWFGAGVFCDFPSKGFWFMSLSLSHYLRMLYEGRDLDSSAFSAKIADNLAAYNKFAGSEYDIPIIDIVRPDSREKGTVIYSKGPALVHKLRNCVGNDVWNNRIRSLYRDYLGKVITIDDFVKAFTVSGFDCTGELWRDLQRKGL